MVEEQNRYREKYKKNVLPDGTFAEFWLERRGEEIRAHQVTHSSNGGSIWKGCSQAGCLGEALAAGQCLVHSTAEERQKHLSIIPGSRNSLSLRGLLLTQEIWDEIFASPIFVDGAPTAPISFLGSDISAAICIRNREIKHNLEFTGAAVFKRIELTQCKFTEGLYARFCLFRNAAINCGGSEFLKDVDLSYSQTETTNFEFENCIFNGHVVADGINGVMHLERSELKRTVSFKLAQGQLFFNEAQIYNSIDLTQANLHALWGEQLFSENANRIIGPCKIQFLNLNRATFASRIHLDVDSEKIDLSYSVLKGGGLINIQAKSLELKQINIGAPLRIAGKAQDKPLTEIGSLLNSDAGKMSFSLVDMSKCSFHGAQGLENINIDSTVKFAKGRWWAGRRSYIADEFCWRVGAGAFYSRGWKIEGIHVGTEAPKREKRERGEPQPVLLSPLKATQVASIYRELRRSLEAKSDMSGAADFYYGEMEMRRWSAPFFERILLWIYWGISGYGMRAGRALFWLAVFITLGTCLMTSFDGFKESALVENDCLWARAFIFSTRATLPGVPTLEELSAIGQLIEMALRVLGPLTIALFLIAVRGKLMRKPSE